MADIKWIKITTDIFNDEKMLMIEDMPDADSVIVIWFKLLCLAGRDNNNGILVMNNRLAYTDEMLASIFRRPLNTVRLALAEFEKYGMIEVLDNVYTIPNWEKHQNIDGMDKIREQTRIRVARHREKQKQLASNVSVTHGNGTDKEEDKEKEKKKKKDNKNIFDEICGDCFFSSSALEEKVIEWLEYKNERKEFYVERGMKSLIKQINSNAIKHGDDAVIELIDKCMANNYAGIIFDKLQSAKKEAPKTSYQEQVNNRMSVVDNW